MTYIQKLTLIAAFCILFSPRLCAASQEIPVATVFEVSEGAEVLRPSMRSWIPLEKMTLLPIGSKVRTGGKGSTHIIFEKDLETTVRLDKNSELSLPLDRSLTLFLEKGRLFVLREEGAAGRFEIRARHLRVRMGLGGCILDASKKDARVKVYGGDVSLSSTGTISEGYQFWGRSEGKKRIGRKTRMTYRDTVDWQAWIRQWYEIRDDFFAERLEKEMDF